MKTLYTGHLNVGKDYVYSFIYAETLLDAELHLTRLLNRFVQEKLRAPASLALPVKVVSRPNGWNPPDGYYLPGTSRQYALRYPPTIQNAQVQESSIHSCDRPTDVEPVVPRLSSLLRE